MSPSDIMRKAGKLFLANNPKDTRIQWIKKPQMITYPTGYKGYRATFKAQADGYRPTEMIVECDANGFDMSIR